MSQVLCHVYDATHAYACSLLRISIRFIQFRYFVDLIHVIKIYFFSCLFSYQKIWNTHKVVNGIIVEGGLGHILRNIFFT